MRKVANDRIEEIFTGALERQGADRAAFLDESCEGDAALRDSVLELIEAHDDSDGMLEPCEPTTEDRMIGPCHPRMVEMARRLRLGDAQ